MKRLKYFLLFVIIFLSSSQSFAFDGVRKGFTMGLGLGYAPYANPNLTNYENDYSFDGAGVNFIVGYNWDNKNLLTWEVLGAINIQEKSSDNDAGFIGINSIVWYHYFQPTPRSYYSIIGFGRIGSIAVINNSNSSSIGFGTNGLGFVLGGGYEFTKQLQFSIYYVGGKTSDRYIKVNNNMIYTSVTLLAY